MKTSFSIRGDRLCTCINWLAWANYHLVPNPGNRKVPDGFIGRAEVTALVERFGISARVFAKTDLWADLGDALAATPALRSADIDLSALLGRMAKGTPEAELHLGGFVRFLQMMACGELTEADLMRQSAG